jgi:hypothetical protein
MPITPTLAGQLIPTLWENRIQYAANRRRGLTRMINDTGSRWFGPGGTINWPVMQVWPAALAYTGAVLTDQTTANNIGASIITPSWIYTHAILREDSMQTGIVDLVQAYAPIMAEQLYQKVDIDIAILFQTAVAFVGAAASEWNEGDFLAGISTLLTNGGDKVEIGNIYGAYHTAKWDAIMSTGNIVNASVRGEQNSAAKTGMVEMAYGVKLFFTANIQPAAGPVAPYSNAIFVKDAIWMARKNRPKVELQRNLTGAASVAGTGLSTTVACSTGYGVGYLHKSTTPQFTTDLLVEHRTSLT